MKDNSMKKAIRILRKQLKEGFVEKEGYKIIKHIADGYVSSVFLAEKDNNNYALKIMYPSFIPRLTYKLLLQEPQAYLDVNAVTVSFHKRKLANRLSKTFDSDIEVLDATEQSQEYKGFYMPFVAYEQAKTLKEKTYTFEKITKLRDFFNNIGMPVWSLKCKCSDNIRTNKNRIIVIDYESGILTKTPEGFDLDPVNFENVWRYVNNNKQNLLDKLGNEEFNILKESFDKCRYHTELWHAGEKRIVQRFKSKKELQKTLEGLIDKGILSKSEVENLKSNELTNYVISNLGVHLAIGCVTTIIPVTFPTGWIPRGIWTLGNWGYCSIKGDKEKARVHSPIHSPGVLLWSTLVPVPMINSFGYLFPLKKINETAALVYGEHIIRVMKGESLKEYLDKRSRFVRGLVEKSIIPKFKRGFYVKNEK